MMNFLKPVMVAVTVLSATMAQVGGPVIIEEGQGEVVAEKPASSMGILPVLGALGCCAWSPVAAGMMIR